MSASRQPPRPVWSGEFSFGGITLKCHTLDSGDRVIEDESLKAFLGWLEHGPRVSPENTDLLEFCRWQQGAVALGRDGKLLDKEGT